MLELLRKLPLKFIIFIRNSSDYKRYGREERLQMQAQTTDLCFINGNGQRDDCLMRLQLALIIWKQVSVISVSLSQLSCREGSFLGNRSELTRK